MEGASAHHFSTHFKKALPPNSAQVIRIAQEMAALSTSLPLDLGSAIFIRTVSHILLDGLFSNNQGFESSFQAACLLIGGGRNVIFVFATRQCHNLSSGGRKVDFQNPVSSIFYVDKFCKSQESTKYVLISYL